MLPNPPLPQCCLPHSQALPPGGLLDPALYVGLKGPSGEFSHGELRWPQGGGSGSKQERIKDTLFGAFVN